MRSGWKSVGPHGGARCDRVTLGSHQVPFYKALTLLHQLPESLGIVSRKAAAAEAAAAAAAQAAEKQQQQQQQQQHKQQQHKQHKQQQTSSTCTRQAAHKHTSIQAAGGYGGSRRGPGEVQARSKAAHPSPNIMPSPEAPKLQSAHGHMPKIQSAHSSTLQRHQRPSSQAHTAAALCNAPAPKLPSTPCGGTSAQA